MWRDQLRPASFRGVRFRVDVSAVAGGRRGQTFEFPKRDRPLDEDLGRRAARFVVSGWVIGADYLSDARALEAACTAEGSGLLILPTIGEIQVRCETYTRSERRSEGGLANFDMSFVEAPRSGSSQPKTDTKGAVQASAYSLDEATLSRMDTSIKAGPK